MVAATDLVKVTPVDADGEGKGVEVYVTAAELATGGSGFTQMTNTAAVASPFGSLTVAADAFNALLVKLKASGLMAPDA
jgi:hypothetical protein